MKSVTFTEPPNHRASQSCGTCKHWERDYEGEGACQKYPEEVSTPSDVFMQIYEGESSTMLCDDWTKNEPE
jgi:hypothetical protein